MPMLAFFGNISEGLGASYSWNRRSRRGGGSGVISCTLHSYFSSSSSGNSDSISESFNAFFHSKHSGLHPFFMKGCYLYGFQRQ